MSDKPLSLYPQNPHYLRFRGKPTTLITSAEHYGAVMNSDFDTTPYLDTLAACEFNLTRLFSGSYRELPGSHSIENNTLAPKPESFLCPWQCVERSPEGVPLKWDLTRWDDAYWQRLRDFVAAAGERGIVVEYVFFCYFYNDTLWQASPMYPENNVNGLVVAGRGHVFALENVTLLAFQEALVRKAAQELAAFDNVYFEIINEPYCNQDGTLFLEWQHHLVDVLTEAESASLDRHLIALNYENRVARIANHHPRVGILNFHYAIPDAVAWNYHLNCVLADDETGFKGSTPTPYRTEAWSFMLSGGAILSHLDYSFTVARPDGTAQIVGSTPGHGGVEWRTQLTALKRFLDGFDLTAMAPCPEVAVQANALYVRSAVLAEIGRQYAVYLWDGGPTLDFVLALPAGDYVATWVNPADGKVISTVILDGHDGGGVKLRTPIFLEDVALKVART